MAYALFFMNLPPNLTCREVLSVHVHYALLESNASVTASKLPAGTFCPATACTFPAESIPVTVPPLAGQGVPAGAVVRFEQKNTMIPPGVCTLPKWMCDCVTAALSPEYVSSKLSDCAFLSSVKCSVRDRSSRGRWGRHKLGQRDQLMPVGAGRAAGIVPADVAFVVHPMVVGVILDLVSRAGFGIDDVEGSEDGVLAAA
jgi:hypothetical protein